MAQVSGAGIRAAMQYWPDAFDADADAVLEKLLPGMRPLRPVMGDSHETMMMARLLQDGKSSAELLADWPTAFAQGCKQHGATAEELDEYLEDFRCGVVNTQQPERDQCPTLKGVASNLRRVVPRVDTRTQHRATVQSQKIVTRSSVRETDIVRTRASCLHARTACLLVCKLAGHMRAQCHRPAQALRRAKWMADVPDDSPDSYLSANEPFPGVEHALRMCEFPYYMASSKRASRVAKLATDVLNLSGFQKDSPRMVTGLMPPSEKKTEALGYAQHQPDAVSRMNV